MEITMKRMKSFHNSDQAPQDIKALVYLAFYIRFRLQLTSFYNFIHTSPYSFLQLLTSIFFCKFVFQKVFCLQVIFQRKCFFEKKIAKNFCLGKFFMQTFFTKNISEKKFSNFFAKILSLNFFQKFFSKFFFPTNIFRKKLRNTNL